MTQMLYVIAALACPVGMGLMMWLMMRGGRQQQPVSPSASTEEIASLRAEVDQLRAAQRDHAVADRP